MIRMKDKIMEIIISVAYSLMSDKKIKEIDEYNNNYYKDNIIDKNNELNKTTMDLNIFNLDTSKAHNFAEEAYFNIPTKEVNMLHTKEDNNVEKDILKVVKKNTSPYTYKRIIKELKKSGK